MSELQEQEDWTVDTTVLARNILVYLGIGNKKSLEPGVDYRRDKICGMIESEIDRRIAAVREECAKIARSKCQKCDGAGWLWGDELYHQTDETATDTMTKYSCDGNGCATAAAIRSQT